MIEKERLKELIKQKATIYTWNDITGFLWLEEKLSFEEKVFEIKLRKTDRIYKGMTGTVLESEDHPISTLYTGIPLEYLFETKWEMEFGNITRTETLSLPTWDEFKEEMFVKFSTPDKKILAIETTLIIDFSKDNDLSEYSLCITDINDYEHNKLFQSEFTEEGYLQACEKAKQLFLEG